MRSMPSSSSSSPPDGGGGGGGFLPPPPGRRGTVATARSGAGDKTAGVTAPDAGDDAGGAGPDADDDAGPDAEIDAAGSVSASCGYPSS
jgi:hypothetical protein